MLGKLKANRKSYASPTLNKLQPEEAEVLLETQAKAGNNDAEDLLDLLSLVPKET